MFVRTRDGWACCRCLKSYPPPTMGLHCAHAFTRRGKSTRFYPDAAAALCYGDHQYVDSHPEEKEELFRRKFGNGRYDAACLRSKFPIKLDEKAVFFYLESEMALLGYDLRKSLKERAPVPLASLEP